MTWEEFCEYALKHGCLREDEWTIVYENISFDDSGCIYAYNEDAYEDTGRSQCAYTLIASGRSFEQMFNILQNLAE